MKSKPARFSSTEWPRARASGLESPTFSPPTRRSTAPVICNRASMRVVLPELVGPTSAKARTDPTGWIGMVVLPSPWAPRTHVGVEAHPWRGFGTVADRSRGSRRPDAETLRPEFPARQITNAWPRVRAQRLPAPARLDGRWSLAVADQGA